MERSKIKKKNVLYNICGSILSYKNDGNYCVLIEKDYDNYNLKKNDMCIFPNNLIKK